MPTLGSMVQKGKLAAAALPFSTMALKRVDYSSSSDKDRPAVAQSKEQHAASERDPLRYALKRLHYRCADRGYQHNTAHSQQGIGTIEGIGVLLLAV